MEYAPIGFDASVVDLFPALAKGATLCIASDRDRIDPQRLAALIRDRHVDTAYIAPVMLAQIREELSELQTIIVAGETTPADVVARWASDRRLFNLYGPTENTVFSTGALLSPDTPPNDIGVPITGVSCYILDEYRRPVPDGVPGELYIGECN